MQQAHSNQHNDPSTSNLQYMQNSLNHQPLSLTPSVNYNHNSVPVNNQQQNVHLQQPIYRFHNNNFGPRGTNIANNNNARFPMFNTIVPPPLPPDFLKY